MSFATARRAAAMFTLALALAPSAPVRAAAQASAGKDYTPADVSFMQGMIMHHAQAVVMSDWAATHGARADVATLCKRIALSQRDEIEVMQHWLEQRHESAPDPLDMQHPHTGPVTDSSPMHMPGMDMGAMPMLMAGMLSPAEMRALDAARGTEFDRLYLTGMIKHHTGALDMVKQLFATPGGGQQSELFGFATDIDASQRAEIARMQLMLQSLPTTSTHTR